MKRTQSQSSMHYSFLENETYSTLSSRSKLIFHACFQLWTKRGEKPVTIDKYLNHYIALYISEETFDFLSLYNKTTINFKKLGLTIRSRKFTFVFPQEVGTISNKNIGASQTKNCLKQTSNCASQTEKGVLQTNSCPSHTSIPAETDHTQTPIHHNFTSTSSLKKRRR